ncbi:MAG: cysteinyl-tRNA synthetase, partial [Chloroflexota bacterium]|nr:cysteinyl-tRNA synthetase [Chloroflexota bacterium]
APLSSGGRSLHERFIDALDDDLDLPTALAVVRETLRADLVADERRWLILDADYVLGLDLDRAAAADMSLPADVQALVDERARARLERDYSSADRIRSELLERGYAVTDGPGGQSIERR